MAITHINMDSINFDAINSNPIDYAQKTPIKTLEKIIGILNDKYYNTDSPLVDDNTFDILIDVLRERDPHNKILTTVGAHPTSKNVVDLPHPMPSLDKIKPGEKSLYKWFDKYKGPYIVSDKLDGISAQIHKNENGQIHMYTRGKNIVGRDITHLLSFIVPKQALENLPINTSVRGEILISRKKFKDLQYNYKNPRNTVSGIVNSDTPDKHLVKKMVLVTYSIIYPRFKCSEQLHKLTDWGFKVVWNNALDDVDDIDAKEIELQLIKLLEERKQESEFDVDGIVVTDDHKIYQHSDKNPPYAMAFKTNVAQNMKNATVVEVIWEPTMYGYLQPILRIDPIDLLGTTITYATGHNAKYIYDNKIGVGSIIKIVRSGDVIPYVVSVVKPNKQADMPSIKYEWNDTQIDIIVVDPSEEVKRMINIKRNVHFFKTIGAKYISQGHMAKLYDAGFMKVHDLIEAAVDNCDIEMSGMGTVLRNKIYDQIKKCIMTANLPEIMAGSLIFGRGIGVKKLKEIIKTHPNFLTYNDKDMKKIIETIPNFSDKSAQKIAGGFSKIKRFLKKIETLTSRTFMTEQPDTKNDLGDQIIVMTGFRDNELSNYIESHGGKVTNSVSKNTTIVLYASNKDTQSTKCVKAKELNIPLMTKDAFVKKFNIK